VLMVSLASSAAWKSLLDANPNMIGVYDLTNTEFREGDPEDYTSFNTNILLHCSTNNEQPSLGAGDDGCIWLPNINVLILLSGSTIHTLPSAAIYLHQQHFHQQHFHKQHHIHSSFSSSAASSAHQQHFSSASALHQQLQLISSTFISSNIPSSSAIYFHQQQCMKNV